MWPLSYATASVGTAQLAVTEPQATEGPWPETRESVRKSTRERGPPTSI